MPFDPMGLPQIQNDLMRGQRDLQMADALMQTGYIPNSGGWGALAQVLGAWRGKRLEKKAGERVSDAMRRQMEYDAAAKAEERERAAAAEEAEYQRNLGRRRNEAGDQVLNPKKPREPINIGNQLVMVGDDGQARVLHETPRAPQQGRQPTAIEVQVAMARQLGASDDQIRALVLGGGEKPLSARDQIALRKDQEAQQTRGAAINNALSILGDMEQATEAGIGGPIASLGLNPFTNRLTDAGQAIEKYDADAASLQDELTRIQRIPGIGTQTDFELRQMLRALPTSSMTEETRRAVLQRIRNKLTELQPAIDAAQAGAIGGPIQQAPIGDMGGWSITPLD